MKRGRTLRELFSFPGFVAEQKLIGKMGAPKARIVDLRRRGKKDDLFGMRRSLWQLL